jgi:hypothetical protein
LFKVWLLHLHHHLGVLLLLLKLSLVLREISPAPALPIVHHRGLGAKRAPLVHYHLVLGA